MRYRSSYTLRENFEELRSSSDDLETFTSAVARQLREIHAKILKLEKLLELVEHDSTDAYDSITKSLVIVRELIDETD